MFFIFIANRKPFSFTRSPPNSVSIIIIPPSLESIRMQTKLFSKTSTAQHLFSFSQFVFLFSFYFLRETKCFRAHSPFHQKKGKKKSKRNTLDHTISSAYTYSNDDDEERRSARKRQTFIFSSCFFSFLLSGHKSEWSEPSSTNEHMCFNKNEGAFTVTLLRLLPERMLRVWR